MAPGVDLPARGAKGSPRGGQQLSATRGGVQAHRSHSHSTCKGGGAPCPAVDGLQRCVATQQTPPVSLCTSTLTAQGGHLQVFVVKGKKGVGREEGQGGAAPQAGPGSGGAPEASRSSRHRPASDDPAGNEQNNLGALTTPAEMDEPLDAWQQVDTSEPASQEGECGGQRHIPGQPISGRGTGWELPGEVT